MNWLLLNQLYVNLDSKSLGISVLEEVVSSEALLVQVLASGRISLMTLTSHFHGMEDFNQIAQGNRL